MKLLSSTTFRLAQAGQAKPVQQKVLFGRITVLAVLIIAWEISAHVRSDIRSSFPTFSGTIKAFIELWTDRDIASALLSTIGATIVATVLCSVLGIIIGVPIASKPFARRSTQFIVDFCRNIPSLAVIPIFLLIMGSTQEMKIALIVAVGIWPVLIQVILGIQNVDASLVVTAKSFQIPYWRRLLYIVLPAATPYIATGIRICISISLLLAIGAELIVGIPGLGREMLISQQAGDSSRTFAIILLSGLIGVVLNAITLRLEKKYLYWFYLPREAAH